MKKPTLLLLSSLLLMIVSCSKDYDHAISELVVRITRLDSMIYATQNAVATVLVKVNSMKTVKEVRRSESGLTLVLSDNTEYIFSNGSSGGVGIQWSIGDPGGRRYGDSRDSVWYLNGERTEYVAIPSVPSVLPMRSPGIDSDGYWVMYEWDAVIGDFVSHRTAYKVIGEYVSYITDDPADTGRYILYVRKEAAGQEYVSVSLPKYVSGVIGGGGDLSIGLHGYIMGHSGVGDVSLGLLESELRIRYWHISRLHDVLLDRDTLLWLGRREVRVNQVLTTLSGSLCNLVVSLSGGEVPYKSPAFGLRLLNSRGEEMPLVLGDPILISGVLTRSTGSTSTSGSGTTTTSSFRAERGDAETTTSSFRAKRRSANTTTSSFSAKQRDAETTTSSFRAKRRIANKGDISDISLRSLTSGGKLYLISLESSSSALYENVSKAHLFRDLFSPKALYYLESTGSVIAVSNYSPFTIVATLESGVAPVSHVISVTPVSSDLPSGAPVLLSAGSKLSINTYYRIDFDLNGEYIFDYELINSSAHPSIQIDSPRGLFTISSTGSGTTLPLTIRKLHVDGTIHTESLSLSIL